MQFTIKGKAFISENTSSDFTSLLSFINTQTHNPQADSAKRHARVLIPHVYLHPGKGKY
jgi:hypothetical protein